MSDGTTHATLPRGADPQGISLDEGLALLLAREGKGGVKKKRTAAKPKTEAKPKTAPKKKPAAKKAPAKKAIGNVN